MLKRLAATTAIGLVLASPALAGYEAGMDAYGEANYGIALDEFQASAREGDAQSQYMLGQLYAEGLGVRQDMGEAYKWYALAAAWGHDRADEARRNLERYMTQSEIAEAREAAERWRAPGTGDNETGAAFTVQNTQRTLNRLGYNAGPVDGIMGPSTRSAIRTYQSDENLAVTGRLTRDLFERMRADLTGGESENASTDLVANIQSELRQRGYDIASVSGRMDDPTREAIRDYQYQSGMAVNGEASQSLLARLRSSQGTGDAESRRFLVRSVQTELNDMGYAAGPEDGVYGPTTRSAVRAYQSDHGLPVTGEVTQSLLGDIREGDSESAEARERREMVRKVEEELAARGYGVGEVDGEVDFETRSAVRTYQSDAGLTIDGQVDAELLSALTETPPDGDAVPHNVVLAIQQELNQRGYNAGPEDGALGPSTRRAIVTFQDEHGLQVTGEPSERLLGQIRANIPLPVADNDGDGGNDGVSPDLIREVENELTRLGWDVGTPNGEWGRSSRLATREYQSRIGVEVDGEVDRELLGQLRNTYRRGETETLIYGLAQQFLQAIQNGGDD